ncbi:MAG: SpoVR family protein [Pirellulales bacterium]|nr:SpoVR family protein [Pirellulales bacterium]
MALHDWTIADLETWDKRIQEVAASFGLTPYPVDFRVYDYEQMLDVHAYHMPFRYSHWSFGKTYDVQKTLKHFELTSLAYEMVVNTNPAQAFCWRDNSLPLHVLVMAHVYGHSDFFANNVWFRTLTNARGALELFRAHADEIAAYCEDPSIPFARMEALMDAGHALMFHRPRILGRRRETPEQQRARLVRSRHAEPGEWDHLKPREQRQKPPLELDRVPLEPDEDLLRFLAEFAPLQDWERRVLEIIAKESDYFTPNIATKTMNEGWATYWHDRIFHSLPDRPAEFDVEYADKMSGVVLPGGMRMNPYHIGWHIWRDIYRRWEDPDREERDNWGRTGGQGLAKLFEVRDTENDASFISNYLTDELIAELKLFRYQWARDADGQSVYRVLDVPDPEGYEKIRRAAVMQVGHNLFPLLRILDANYYHDRTLVLEHVHDGRDLKVFEPELPIRDVRTILREKGELSGEVLISETGEVLKHILTIWKNPIVLRTHYDGTALALRCDREGRIAIEIG